MMGLASIEMIKHITVCLISSSSTTLLLLFLVLPVSFSSSPHIISSSLPLLHHHFLIPSPLPPPPPQFPCHFLYSSSSSYAICLAHSSSYSPLYLYPLHTLFLLSFPPSLVSTFASCLLASLFSSLSFFPSFSPLPHLFLLSIYHLKHTSYFHLPYFRTRLT